MINMIDNDFRYWDGISNYIAKFEKVSLPQFKGAFDDFTDNRINQIYQGIKLPKRATKGSAGYDFFLPMDIKLNPGETIKIPTGIRCRINDGYVLELYPRSGLGFKYRLQLNNTVGIIDSDYYYSDNEGHIFAKITNDSNEGKVLELKAGDAFMQGIFKQYFLAEEEPVVRIRDGGFGSTSVINIENVTGTLTAESPDPKWSLSNTIKK